MSGGDLPPRQKMIGMMYLVLTALLALNVSKDILDAFVLINTSLEKTVINYDEKNEMLYADFNQAKTFDPVKVTPIWDKAQIAKKKTAVLVNYIQDLQSKLLQETEKITASEADTLQLKYANGKDNYDIPTNIMIGQSEDGSKGLARELKAKINAYKKEMLALFSEKEQKSLKIDLKTADIQTAEGIENWEMGNFYHTPLAASVTLLSKMQTDIKNVEYDVVNTLLQYAGSKKFNFDTIVTKVIPRSNYVLMGEDYKADVFLAAFSTTQNPEIVIGKYDSIKNDLISVDDTIPVSKGLGQYSVPTNREGLFTYEGVLRLKNSSGGVENFPFKSEYIVARPSLVVSPDKMNVFYVGPNNPVSVSVPGVPSENIRATITGAGNRITKTANGKYTVKLSNSSPRNVDVKVSAMMENGETRNMGKLTFVVKRLPKPYAEVGGVSVNKAIKSVTQLRRFRRIIAKYDANFVFQGLPLTIVSYTFEYLKSDGDIFSKPVRGGNGLITEEIKTKMRRLRRGNDVYFSDIKARDVNGKIIKLNDIRIKVR